MIKHPTVCIEVPNEDNSDWINLEFSLTNVPAPDEQPLKLSKTRSAKASALELAANVMLAKLRHAFFVSGVNEKNDLSLVRQIGLRDFSADTESTEPNLQAFNLALLMADLYFKQVIKLSEHVALEAGYCLEQGFINLPSCLVAPNNRQGTLAAQDTRNSLVYRLKPDSQMTRHYDTPNYNFELLQQVVARAPHSIYQGCVHYPVVDSAGDAHQLSLFNVAYIPSDEFKLTVIGSDKTFRFEVVEFVNSSTDIGLLLTGQLLLECGVRPSKGHKSWQLALVSALQIALGVMPAGPNPLICTGEIKTDPNDDNFSRQVTRVGQCDVKYHFIKQLKSQEQLLTGAFGAINSCLPWFFCLPEENYYQIEVNKDDSVVNCIAVTYWFVDDLMGAI